MGGAAFVDCLSTRNDLVVGGLGLGCQVCRLFINHEGHGDESFVGLDLGHCRETKKRPGRLAFSTARERWGTYFVPGLLLGIT